MLVERTKTFLEMTSLDELSPGRPSPEPIVLRRADPADIEPCRTILRRIGEPYHWTQRSTEDWQRTLSREGVRVWIARTDDEILGLVQLDAHPAREVELAAFGLVPEFVGKGFGGDLLTVATRLAWETPFPDGSTGRVWVTTTSMDHPGAMPNYLKRGFRPFRTEQELKEISE